MTHGSDPPADLRDDRELVRCDRCADWLEDGTGHRRGAAYVCTACHYLAPVLTVQEQADAVLAAHGELLDAVQTAELTHVYRRQLRRLATAQALVWSALSRDEQRAYLQQVDTMKGQS